MLKVRHALGGGLTAYQYGRGEEVTVAFHGWSGDHEVYAAVADRLAPHQRLYAFDLPGSGESEEPSSYTLEAMTALIVEAIETLGIERATVVGNCGGAVLALELARRLGPRVDRLVLIDPFAFAPWYFRLLAAPYLGPLFYFSAFANPIGRRFTNAALFARRTSRTDLTRGFARVDHRAAYRFFRMLVAQRRPERYAHLRCAVSLVYGERTFAAVRRSVARFHAMWPDAHVVTLPGAGHLPIQEATDAVAALVLSDERGSGGARAERRLACMK